MSTDYSKMSDFEINLLVAKIILNGNIISERERTLTSSVFYENHQGIKTFDPCNNPADAWPIIAGNEISLISRCANGEWKAQLHLGKDDIFDSYASCWDINPLKAAMIVFLMMQESKSAS